MERLMQFEPFRQMYKDALNELIDPDNSLLHIDASMQRIQNWQNLVRPYVNNDTGEDTAIYDQPAYWGTQDSYRLLERGSNNFFTAKEESIKAMK
jgi:hypothetical protein